MQLDGAILMFLDDSFGMLRVVAMGGSGYAARIAGLRRERVSRDDVSGAATVTLIITFRALVDR